MRQLFCEDADTKIPEANEWFLCAAKGEAFRDGTEFEPVRLERGYLGLCNGQFGRVDSLFGK